MKLRLHAYKENSVAFQADDFELRIVGMAGGAEGDDAGHGPPGVRGGAQAAALPLVSAFSIISEVKTREVAHSQHYLNVLMKVHTPNFTEVDAAVSQGQGGGRQRR